MSLRKWLIRKIIRKAHGITVNYLTLRFDDQEVQRDYDKHVTDGQASMYYTMLCIMLLKITLRIVLKNNKGFGLAIVSSLTTLLLIVGGVLFRRIKLRKYWIWVANFWLSS